MPSSFPPRVSSSPLIPPRMKVASPARCDKRFRAVGGGLTGEGVAAENRGKEPGLDQQGVLRRGRGNGSGGRSRRVRGGGGGGGGGGGAPGAPGGRRARRGARARG